MGTLQAQGFCEEIFSASAQDAPQGSCSYTGERNFFREMEKVVDEPNCYA